MHKAKTHMQNNLLLGSIAICIQGCGELNAMQHFKIWLSVAKAICFESVGKCVTCITMLTCWSRYIACPPYYTKQRCIQDRQPEQVDPERLMQHWRLAQLLFNEQLNRLSCFSQLYLHGGFATVSDSHYGIWHNSQNRGTRSGNCMMSIVPLKGVLLTLLRVTVHEHSQNSWSMIMPHCGLL